MLPGIIGTIGNVVENASEEVPVEKEMQNWSGFSVAIHIFLPVAGLALFWGRKDIFTKLLLQLDRSCVSVFCPSLSKREKILKWASGRLPLTWSSQASTLSGGVIELWTDGSLLCTLINSAVPGACPNPHRHWKKPPIHAQAVAYKYLGVVPIFTESDLSGDFTLSQERNFLHYMHELQTAINKLSARDDIYHKFSSQYVARGMGLFSGEQHKKTVFYIYPNASLQKNSNVLIQIRGPYGTFGKATIPHFHNYKSNKEITVVNKPLNNSIVFPETKNEKLLNKQKSFFRSISLDFTSFINSQKKDANDDILIKVDYEDDRVKVTYLPKNYGMYEINLISNGELVTGCPFHVHIINNATETQDNFDENLTKSEENILNETTKIIAKSSTKSLNNDKNLEKISNNEINLLKNKISKDLKEDNLDQLNNLVRINPENTKEEETKSQSLLSLIHEESSNEKNSSFEENLEIFDKNEDKRENFATNINNGIDINKGDSKDEHFVENINNENDIVKVKDIKLKFEDEEEKEICPESTDEIDSINLLSQTPAITNILEDNTPKILDSKYFKNIVNSNASPEKHSSSFENEDLNNNIPEFELVPRLEAKIQNLPMENKIAIIPTRFFENVNPELIPNPENVIVSTSPICPDHIVSEVDNKSKSKSLTEKRKIFQKQSYVSLSDSQNSSFSNDENDEGSGSVNNNLQNIDGLSVLNVLDSLKQTEKSLVSEPKKIPLSCTKSLPNIPRENIQNDKPKNSLVKEKKTFWEQLSSRSSTSMTNISCSSSTNESPVRKSYNRIRAASTLSLVPKENLQNGDSMRYKSESNILSLEFDSWPCPLSKKYISLDDSLELCESMTIEERKKLLLKKNYEKEKNWKETLKVNKLIKSGNFFNKNKRDAVDGKDDDKSRKEPDILQRIRKYNENTISRTQKVAAPIQETEEKRSKIKISKSTPDVVLNSSNYIQNDLSEKSKASLRSHFKKARGFFKNLEEKALGRSKSTPKLPTIKNDNEEKLNRRYSLDYHQNRKKTNSEIKGGSLNLSKISERFSINNLYSDVFGSLRKGSFKGIPNNTYVIDSLSSIASPTNEGSESNTLNNNEDLDLDNIKSSNLFKHRSKSKQRKSLKSIFDVNY